MIDLTNFVSADPEWREGDPLPWLLDAPQQASVAPPPYSPPSGPLLITETALLQGAGESMTAGQRAVFNFICADQLDGVSEALDFVEGLLTELEKIKLMILPDGEKITTEILRTQRK